MTEHSQQATLQRELAKHQAAAADFSAKIAVIEAEERRKREAKEAKERALASDRRRLEACQRWISATEKKIAEAKEAVATEVKAVCSGEGQVLMLLENTVRELGIWESEMGTFKTYEASLRAKIEAH